MLETSALAGTALIVLGVLAALGMVATVVWVWSLVDVLKRPAAQWEAAEQNKTLWIVLVLVLGVLGSLAYMAVPRPALKRFAAAADTVFDPTAFGVPQGGMVYGHDGFEPRA